MFPPAILANQRPQSPNLKSEGPTLGEEVVARLFLAAAAPPTVAGLPSERACHSLVQEGPDRRVTQEELVISVRQGLPRSSQGFSPEPGARGGPVPAFWPNVGGDSLGRSPRAVLRDHPGEVRYTGLPSLLVWDAVLEAAGRLLGELVGISFPMTPQWAGAHKTLTGCRRCG